MLHSSLLSQEERSGIPLEADLFDSRVDRQNTRLAWLFCAKTHGIINVSIPMSGMTERVTSEQLQPFLRQRHCYSLVLVYAIGGQPTLRCRSKVVNARW